MDSRPLRSTIAALAALSLLALPAAATGAGDYSENAATGDYEHGPLPPAGLAKDYSKNSATGDYAPAKPGSAQVLTVADDGGFDWGDATIGAVVTLALGLVALGATTVVRRRRIASPAT
jgi:hypothetical protein